MGDTKFDRILRDVVRRLEEDEWAEGDQFTTIVGLAARYGVSNSLINGVVKTLRARGYIKRFYKKGPGARGRHGYCVAPKNEWGQIS